MIVGHIWKIELPDANYGPNVPTAKQQRGQGQRGTYANLGAIHPPILPAHEKAPLEFAGLASELSCRSGSFQHFGV